MVKLRLKRYGRKQQPTYRIIAIDAKARREGKALKELGFYNPLKNSVKLDVENIIFLLKNGAQPTETVYNILVKEQVFKQMKRFEKNLEI